MNITLKQLRVFLAIVNHGNMTRAAESLFMTKGALSQSLAELETQLNAQIFDRRNSRLHINDAGLKLMPFADEMLNRMKHLENEFSLKRTVPSIKIGCTKSIGSFFIADLLQQFEASAGWLPNITIENIETIQEMLSRFELDLALIESSVIDPSLHSEHWMQDEMIIVAAKNHPLANKNFVSYEALNKERWIIREDHSASRHFFDQQLVVKFEAPITEIVLNAFDVILLSVVNKLGLTFISKKCLDHPIYAEHLIQLNVDDQFLRNLYIVYPKEKYLSPHVLAWIHYLKS